MFSLSENRYFFLRLVFQSQLYQGLQGDFTHCRVKKWHCCHSLPLEQYVKVSFHTAQASTKPLCRSRWHNKSYATFTILTCSLLTHCRRMHTLWLKRSFAFPPLRKILQISSWRDTRRKSALLPVGMMLPCGVTPIRAITERPSLFPPSYTRPLSAFLTVGLPLLAEVRVYRVPYK